MNTNDADHRIRHYQSTDAGALAELYGQLYAARPLTAQEFHQELGHTLGGDGQAWVMVTQDRPIAFTAISLVPGLPGVAHLEGFVTPDWQRQGIGRRLLEHVYQEAKRQGLKQLSCPLANLDSPGSYFLLGHGFELEHEEAILRRPTLAGLPAVSITRPAAIVTLPRQTAIKQFCALYEQIFAGLPWYQPYTHAEVASLLQTADDLLFLHLDKKPYGFVWHQLDGGMGVVEPIGVVDSLRGRGYGRYLLLAALHRLRDRGAQQAQIGAWTTNQQALCLYESLGFRHEHSLYYLALDL